MKDAKISYRMKGIRTYISCYLMVLRPDIEYEPLGKLCMAQEHIWTSMWPCVPLISHDDDGDDGNISSVFWAKGPLS